VYASSSPNFDALESAYVKMRNPETAVLCILDNVHDIVAGVKPTVLINLDVSAAFDSISHDILIWTTSK